MFSTRVRRRLYSVARRLADLIDELTGVRGEIGNVIELYENERKVCPCCAACLDKDGNCPLCFSSQEVQKEEDV